MAPKSGVVTSFKPFTYKDYHTYQKYLFKNLSLECQLMGASESSAVKSKNLAPKPLIMLH